MEDLVRSFDRWFVSERWELFAGGDPDVAPKFESSPSEENSPWRLLFETGLVLLIPLALAALIQIILGT